MYRTICVLVWVLRSYLDPATATFASVGTTLLRPLLSDAMVGGAIRIGVCGTVIPEESTQVTPKLLL
jgi:hypothetical protein